MRLTPVSFVFALALAGCGGGSASAPRAPSPCLPGVKPVCTEPPTYLAVAQRGSGKIALYAAPFTGAPASILSAPGAESFAAAPTVDTPRTFYIGEFPNTIASSAFPYTSITPAIVNGVNDPAGMVFGTVQTSPNSSSLALFVANRGADDVAVYVWANNASAPAFTLSGLHAPNGVAFDNKGDLWVSESSDIVEYAPPVSATSSPAAIITAGLKAPSGIAFDQSGATMYVSDAGNNSVEVFPAGAASPSVTITSGLSAPGTPYLTSSYLYVPNSGNNTVAAFALPLSAPTAPAWVNAQSMDAPAAAIVGF